MLTQFSRTEMLLGKEAVDKLSEKKVAIFGVGGVGGYVCEALVRTGIGHFVLVDNDKVSLTNLNRQIIALHSTIGRYKVDVMKERMLDINPQAEIETYKCFFLPENADSFPFETYDYVVDAIDTVTAKLEIVSRCTASGVPVISSMGTGNKLDPTRFCITDINKTTICPLAKVMRQELRKRGIKRLKVVFSDEMPLHPIEEVAEQVRLDSEADREQEPTNTRRRDIPGSAAFVPAAAGLVLASEVVKDLIGGYDG